MTDLKKLPTSDDEDLEALRLAALRSLKKKNSSLYDSLQAHHMPQRSPDKFNRFNRSLKGLQNKRGRFFGPHQGRNGKNGQFSNRNRNPNLISIPTIAPEEKKIQEMETAESGAKINLPQHKYCEETKQESEKEGTSKFSRYNKSDESESESEEEQKSDSEDDSPGKLHKADSLEALMQELDDEIQGKSKAKENLPAKSEKTKTKKIKKKKRTAATRVSTSDSDAKPSDQIVEKPESDVNVEVIRHTDNDKANSDGEVKPETPEKGTSEEPCIESKPVVPERYNSAKKRLRSRSPVNRRGFSNRRRPRPFHKFQNPPLQNIPFLPPVGSYPPPVHQFPNPPFNPLFAPPNISMITQPPPFFERPLSPLAINTESLTTATLAPLSPRSAAFVLQNKAIIERRKRSPRRSYSRSRSPSRSPRRSITPRRSPRRSVSPRRISRSPRRPSRSPRRKSLSPKRRSLSPRRRNVARTTDNSPKSKAPVRERLGLKNKTEEGKDKPKNGQSSLKKEEKTLDPILEARKRKFESNEIKVREGIIRLRPKEEKPEEMVVPASVPVSDVAPTSPQVSKMADVPEEKPKEATVETAQELDVIEELENLLKGDPMLEGDDIELNPKVADIFSDEDSASDNEGRFKIKEGSSAKPPVLSFTKLVNGEKREIKAELLPDPKRNERRRDRRDRISKSRTRGRSLVDRKEIAKENSKTEAERKPTLKKSESQDKPHTKSQVSVKNDRHVTPMERRFERKIEIKIKNPSKYERGSGKFKFSKEAEEKPREEVKRKVEVDNAIAEEEEEEPEIIVENNSGDDENSVVSEGDLRAQLSKKRAEKLHRIPVEGISSRLLQNALQGAVFKKTKKKSKEQDITSSEYAAIKKIVHADYFSRGFCLAVKTQRIVRVYKHEHFRFRYSCARTDGKLPIHLRLGIANGSDIFADTTTKVKRKSRKRKNREVLEQV